VSVVYLSSLAKILAKMLKTNPIHTEVVLVGGGHSHAIALRMFGMKAGLKHGLKSMAGVRLTLISENSDTPYSGMLPGYVAGIYQKNECHIDLRSLSQFANAQFYCDRVIGLDLANQRVICANRPTVAYDFLSLDIGSTPQKLDLNCPNSITAKPIPQFLAHLDQFLADVSQNVPAKLSIAIAGGGIGGVELAIALHQRLQDSLPNTQLNFDLVHRGAELLPGHNLRVRRLVNQALFSRQIKVHLQEEVIGQEEVTGLDDQIVRCRSGKTWRCDRLFWVTQATAPDWIKASGLAVDDQGFVLIKNTLQSISHSQVFATGDIATNPQHSRPKAGVFAVRQGQPLFDNLQAIIANLPLRDFIPQSKFLSLIGTADGQAIASRAMFGWRSPLMWWWKNRIDRQFMAKFTDLAELRSGMESGIKKAKNPPIFCGGCGAKVGSNTLTQVLKRLTPSDRSDVLNSVLIGLDQADDACVISIPAGKVLVQTLDYFPAFLHDPYLFGQIAAHHCLNDLLAMGATPHSALAIATITHGNSKAEAETLYQLLAGATKVLNAMRSPLIGGHTTVGADLIFGLSCNGYADPDRLLRKSGIQVGDVLILTKPLGTGAILAAAMQSKTKPEWIDTAIASMLHSNQLAAQILAEYQIHACTDVSGFGLIGHLTEMLRASGVSAKLDLAQISTLPGAIAIAKMGIFSSLYDQNRQAESFISNPKTEVPIYSLLFDPQTSGGLLAAIPASQAHSCLAKLKANGYYQAEAIAVAIQNKDLSNQIILVDKYLNGDY
jgi:selenide, water dikinase